MKAIVYSTVCPSIQAAGYCACSEMNAHGRVTANGHPMQQHGTHTRIPKGMRLLRCGVHTTSCLRNYKLSCQSASLQLGRVHSSSSAPPVQQQQSRVLCSASPARSVLDSTSTSTSNSNGSQNGSSNSLARPRHPSQLGLAGSSAQGERDTMEDDYSMFYDSAQEQVFLGCFDGHGGAKVSLSL